MAEQHSHTIKIKAKVRAKGQRGTGWYNDLMVNYLRKRSRTAMLWSLTLSGDWHPDYETDPIPDMRAHHMMRWGRLDATYAPAVGLASRHGRRCYRGA